MSVHASELQFDLMKPVFQDLNAAGQCRIQIGLIDFDLTKPYAPVRTPRNREATQFACRA
jgi:hypothetical protein